MTSRAALLALLTIWGVGLGGSALPAHAEDIPKDDSSTEAKTALDLAAPELTNRIWVKTGNDEVHGLVRLFLSDGTLVEDNSWGTHHLSSWKMLPGDKLSWDADGKEITARIAALTPDRLTLIVYLEDGPVEEQYRAAPIAADAQA